MIFFLWILCWIFLVICCWFLGIYLVVNIFIFVVGAHCRECAVPGHLYPKCDQTLPPAIVPVNKNRPRVHVVFGILTIQRFDKVRLGQNIFLMCLYIIIVCSDLLWSLLMQNAGPNAEASGQSESINADVETRSIDDTENRWGSSHMYTRTVSRVSRASRVSSWH